MNPDLIWIDMHNELIFLVGIFLVSTAALIGLRLGKEFLIGLISTFAVIVNLFVLKQISLFGFTATASDALAVGITLSLNLMQEFYGKPAAFRAIWVGFFCALVYCVMCLVHLGYAPAALDTSSVHYQALLWLMPRTITASLSTYLIVQRIDAHIYGFLKVYFSDRYFVMRNYSTLAFTQILDTVLFSFLGLYKMSPAYSSLGTLSEIMTISILIKLTVILIAVPYVRLARSLYSVATS
jgi:hypothetical protein